MPTAARLTAALAFAVLGYFTYTLMLPSFGDDVVPSYLLPLCLAAGLWCGWVLCGDKSFSVRSGLGTGLTALIAMIVIILFIMSFVEMIQLSMRRRYDGPMEAIIDIFAIMFENFQMFATPELGLTLFGGGLLAGFVTGVMGKRFPR